MNKSKPIEESPYKIRYNKETNVYESHYPLLNIYSQGTTEEEALKALESAIELSFNKPSVVSEYTEGIGFCHCSICKGGLRKCGCTNEH